MKVVASNNSTLIKCGLQPLKESRRCLPLGGIWKLNLREVMRDGFDAGWYAKNSYEFVVSRADLYFHEKLRIDNRSLGFR